MGERVEVRPFLGYYVWGGHGVHRLADMRWHPNPHLNMSPQEQWEANFGPDFPCRSAEMERLESYHPKGT